MWVNLKKDTSKLGYLKKLEKSHNKVAAVAEEIGCVKKKKVF